MSPNSRRGGRPSPSQVQGRAAAAGMKSLTRPNDQVRLEGQLEGHEAARRRPLDSARAEDMAATLRARGSRSATSGT
jgi:hypothetical protein